MIRHLFGMVALVGLTICLVLTCSALVGLFAALLVWLVCQPFHFASGDIAQAFLATFGMVSFAAICIFGTLSLAVLVKEL